MDAPSLVAWIDERADSHAFSGVVLAWQNDSPLFAHAAGLAHRGLTVPMTIDTRFATGSIA